MPEKDNRIALLSRKESIDIRDVATKIIDMLSSVGFKVYSGINLEHKISNKTHSISELKQLDPQIIVTIGGDGSLLWAIRKMDNEKPVLGINVGGRGILAEVRTDEIENAVKKLASGKYLIENRQRLSASIESRILPPALNEVYINRVSEIRTSTFDLSIENYSIRQKMDGIIISTSTGSTGHSMSFGGAFVHPGPAVLQIIPVGSINRLPPMIIPTHPIEISSDHDSVLVIDGQEEFVVKAFKKVYIRKHKRNARFIRLENKSMRQLENLGF